MTRIAGAILILSSMLASGCGWAQGTYAGTNRSGYTGTTSTHPASAGSSTTGPSSNVSTGVRQGTGQGRSEGAMGLTLQLQHELGIGKQQ